MWSCVLALSSPATWAQPVAAPAWTQELDDALRPPAGAVVPGMSVLVHQAGRLVYEHHSGWADVLTGQTVQPDTPFELASVSKPFTALAVLQLMEKGQLQLQDPVARYLPELPAAWSSMQLHHLLAHQSGLPDVLNDWPRKTLDHVTTGQLLAILTKSPALKFMPGERSAYSNTNYVLLAEVVSRITGLSWDAYLRRHIFDPAGMVDSFTLGAQPDQVLPYALNYAVGEPGDGIHYALPGAIGVKSSARDLHRWVQALVQGRLLQPKSWELMTRVHSALEDGRLYGYGWTLTRTEWRSLFPPVSGGSSFGHTGRLGAHRTALYVDTRKDWDLVVLGNGGKASEALMLKVIALVRQHLEQ